MSKDPSADLNQWQSLSSARPRSRSFDLAWDTPEGIRVKPLYTAQDLDGLAHLNSPVWRRLHVVLAPQCTQGVHGPFVSTQATRQLKNPMHSIGVTLPPGKLVCR